MRNLKPKTVAGLLVVLFIAGYVYFRSENLIKGPSIIITSPDNGATLNTGQVVVTGQAKRIASLFMNDRKVFTDEAGNFQELLLLAYGYNIIELEARDKFGRSTSRTIELVFK